MSVPWLGVPPDLSTLVEYRPAKTVSFYFCRTCGSHMFAERRRYGSLDVMTGVLQDDAERFVKVVDHQHVESTVDGGFSAWLPIIGAKFLPRWRRSREESDLLPLEWPCPVAAARRKRDSQLAAHCHCGGVSFNITRPNDRSGAFTAPLPDVIKKYTNGEEATLTEEKWWLSGDGRYTAGTCACRSCRLASGMDIVEVRRARFPAFACSNEECTNHIQQWGFIPAHNIKMTDGKPFTTDFGTLKAFRSSEDATRYFCDACGATVFWIGDDRPELIDVAVGLLAAPSGARAEDWLKWATNRVSFIEEALHKELVECVEGGLQIWGRREGYDE